MAAAEVKEFKAERAAGEVTVTLRALNGLPIEGVMSASGGRAVEPEPREDPTTIVWRLPLQNERYVVYGIVTPVGDLNFTKVVYERSVTQNKRPCWSYAKNPERIRTRQLSAGEWLGTPEILSIKVR